MAEAEVSPEQAAIEKAGNFIYGEEPQADSDDEPASGDDREVSPEVEGDESDPEQVEADSEQEESDEPEFVEIEIDGELLEVPEKYKDYFLRQEDYTRKTQEVAQQRKEIEVRVGELENKAKQFEFAESIQDDVLKVQQKQAEAEQLNQYLRSNLDSLSSTDIERIRLAISDAEKEADTIGKDVQGRYQEFQQSQQQSFQELLNKGTEVLKAKIPEWSEAKQKELRDYAVSLGIPEQKVNSVVDPAEVEVLYKAMQYDQLKKGAKPAVKRVQDTTIKPKARSKPMPKHVQDKLNLRKKLKADRPNVDKTRDVENYLSKRFNF